MTMKPMPSSFAAARLRRTIAGHEGIDDVSDGQHRVATETGRRQGMIQITTLTT